jgi:1,2-phenylacetyl-CoA epoxidase catalytic subunit
MEEILKEILKELQYHTKLLESMVENFDASRHQSQEKQKEVKDILSKTLGSVFNHPSLKGRPEVEKIKKDLGG